MAREQISRTIMIDRRSYFYLKAIQREQRGCKPLGEDAKERIWKRLKRDRRVNADGLAEVDDDSFGGGDGTYEGKWWGWSVSTLKEMLDEAGLSYQDGPEVRKLSI